MEISRVSFAGHRQSWKPFELKREPNSLRSSCYQPSSTSHQSCSRLRHTFCAGESSNSDSYLQQFIFTRNCVAFPQPSKLWNMLHERLKFAIEASAFRLHDNARYISLTLSHSDSPQCYFRWGPGSLLQLFIRRPVTHPYSLLLNSPLSSSLLPFPLSGLPPSLLAQIPTRGAHGMNHVFIVARRVCGRMGVSHAE